MDVRRPQDMRPPLVSGHYYHVYNRGVLKQPIFFDDADLFRFVHDLYEFNDNRPAPQFGRPTSNNDREQLTSIVAWCLMPNHFHLFLRQQSDGGISLFLKKLGGGYAKYVNEKYERSGHLFQGKYQLKLIEHEAHFLHITDYIHSNPISLIEPGWEESGEIADVKKVQGFLDSYRWSSYLDWKGLKNFPSVLDMHLVKDCFGDRWTSDVQQFAVKDP